MLFQSSDQNGCPICGKETALAAIEPHPTHPDRELHSYRCVDCGPVKTRSYQRSAQTLIRAVRAAPAEAEPLATI